MAAGGTGIVHCWKTWGIGGSGFGVEIAAHFPASFGDEAAVFLDAEDEVRLFGAHEVRLGDD